MFPTPTRERRASHTATPRRLSQTRAQPQSTPRRPSVSHTSIVQQKLQAALQSADQTNTELAQTQASDQSGFGLRSTPKGGHDEAVSLNDRAISRYRSDASLVSFTDPSVLSTYSNTFMPGVHFYTFLAAKESTAEVPNTASTTPSPLRVPNTTPSKGAIAATTPTETIENHREKPRGALKRGRVPALRIHLPDTIVYGESGRGVWLYTDKDGCVRRTTEFTEKMVLDRLTRGAHAGPGVAENAATVNGENETFVVCKEAMVTSAAARHQQQQQGNPASEHALEYQGNLLRLLTPGEVKTVLSNVTSTRSNKPFALQSFVQCNGSKAFIVRAVYDVGKPQYAWMISNTIPIQAPTPTVSQVFQSLGQETPFPANSSTSLPSATADTCERIGRNSITTPKLSSAGTMTLPVVNRLCTSIHTDKACTFIKLNERGCATISELNQRIVKYIEHRLHLRLQSLVADFVKDGAGIWWLLQIKSFRVKSTSRNRIFSLPPKLRLQYLSYRDSSVLEDAADSDSDVHESQHHGRNAVSLAQRQVRKLVQCKCCLAAYPKNELSFKMTLKMINELLVRIRSRLSPEKNYAFLKAVLVRDNPDASLAYECWSVCSYCYAIYERDQQLLRIELKFAQMIGTPNPQIAEDGLGRLEGEANVIDPMSSATVLPPHLTLCRFMLVINCIYDIPAELVDAGNSHAPTVTCEKGRKKVNTVESQLYLRISAVGYTECILINPSDILLTDERAPRAQRRQSMDSARTTMVDCEDDEINEDETTTDEVENDEPPAGDLPSRERNYWLPINLIRTIHFFAPRTPLHAKVKDTSGLSSFLEEDNSIVIQFIRATEPPLKDPTVTNTTHRKRTRRTALRPHRTSMADMLSQLTSPNHCILLGATKIRLAQFRSAYVTKIDFYACMALSGEMFNVKGNIGLERVRYVDTKLLTSQTRLRLFSGVFIPDASYMSSDPLTSEWMDTLRATVNPHVPMHSGSAKDSPTCHESHTSSLLAQHDVVNGNHVLPMRSATSSAGGTEQMDEELEDMIERANGEQQRRLDASQTGLTADARPHLAMVKSRPNQSNDPFHVGATHQANESPTALKEQVPVLPLADVKRSFLPTTKSSSRFESRISVLMTKAASSPRSAVSNTQPQKSANQDIAISTNRTPPERSLHGTCSMYCVVVILNQAYNLLSRERPYCRWECHYQLFGQRRSAIERNHTLSSSGPQAVVQQPTPQSDVEFGCTHKFYLAGALSMMQAYFSKNRSVTLHLRNDVYASTRLQSTGEFSCVLDLSTLLQSKMLDSVLDIHATAHAPELTPREAADTAKAPPFLTVSVQLEQLSYDAEEAIKTGDFVVVGSTLEGLQVLKKIT